MAFRRPQAGVAVAAAHLRRGARAPVQVRGIVRGPSSMNWSPASSASAAAVSGVQKTMGNHFSTSGDASQGRDFDEPLPPHLAEPTRLGTEISVTGKWAATASPATFFQRIFGQKKGGDSELMKEWKDVHNEAKQLEGVLATQLNPAVGGDSVLVHHTFKDVEGVVDYFSTTAKEHITALREVGVSETQLFRGVSIPPNVVELLDQHGVKSYFGEHLFGYVRNDYAAPDPAGAIHVTAIWKLKAGIDSGRMKELKYWWQRVGTDAYDIEKGLVRFEAYDVIGEDAVIIHEVFEDTNELFFHLTKGTAERYKKHLDAIAAPECYFFRGPVSWTIQTYSKFMSLPATYTHLANDYTQPGGTLSEGLRAE